MAVFWLVVLTPQLLAAQVPGRCGPCFEMWQVPNPNWKYARGPHPRQSETDVIIAGKSPGGYECWFCIACGKEANEGHITSPGHDKQVCWYRSVHGASNLAGPASSSPTLGGTTKLLCWLHVAPTSVATCVPISLRRAPLLPQPAMLRYTLFPSVAILRCSLVLLFAAPTPRRSFPLENRWLGPLALWLLLRPPLELLALSWKLSMSKPL